MSSKARGAKKYNRRGSDGIANISKQKRAMVSLMRLNRTKTQESESEDTEECKKMIQFHTPKIYENKSRRVFFKRREQIMDYNLLIIQFDGVIGTFQSNSLDHTQKPQLFFRQGSVEILK